MSIEDQIQQTVVDVALAARPVIRIVKALGVLGLALASAGGAFLTQAGAVEQRDMTIGHQQSGYVALLDFATGRIATLENELEDCRLSRQQASLAREPSPEATEFLGETGRPVSSYPEE